MGRGDAMSHAPTPGAAVDIEEGGEFAPRFSADGLLTCVTVDAHSGEVLMVAHMNAEALDKTLSTGFVHYWSRSRQCLWRKGDTSGQTQRVEELRVDCDQDAVLARVTVGGDGGACRRPAPRAGCQIVTSRRKVGASAMMTPHARR
jgi:phosphoribosyl-AMP cyclohydrolase